YVVSGDQFGRANSLPWGQVGEVARQTRLLTSDSGTTRVKNPTATQQSTSSIDIAEVLTHILAELKIMNTKITEVNNKLMIFLCDLRNKKKELSRGAKLEIG
ncbi:hypothetical protein ACJMK2_028230, partial [Sinanodonta woodiana]